jgi:pyruvate,water dikinase
MFVARFEQLPAGATAIAGGKGASLGRMTSAGLPVPPGFVVCAASFQALLDSRSGGDAILARLQRCDASEPSSLESAAGDIRELIVSTALPPSLEREIRSAHQSMAQPDLVAVRSSAVCEDDARASYAGQQETFLNVGGADAVIGAVKECWASFFSPRALFYRSCKGSLDDLRMAVVVQEMVAAERSGVMFTVDPIRHRRDCMVIEAVFGLGERIVSGEATPDHYVVGRDDGGIVSEFIPQEEGQRVLASSDLDRLRELGLNLETFFNAPQDIEWCMKGSDVFLLQSRPITTLTHAR